MGVRVAKMKTTMLIIRTTVVFPIYIDPIDKPMRIIKNRIKPIKILNAPPNAPKKLTSLEYLGPRVAVKTKAEKPAKIKNRKPTIISTKPMILVTLPNRPVGSNKAEKSPESMSINNVKSIRKEPPTKKAIPIIL